MVDMSQFGVGERLVLTVNEGPIDDERSTKKHLGTFLGWRAGQIVFKVFDCNYGRNLPMEHLCVKYHPQHIVGAERAPFEVVPQE